jgi:hypothetical protein
MGYPAYDCEQCVAPYVTMKLGWQGVVWQVVHAQHATYARA